MIMKRITLIALLMTVGLFISSCKKEDDVDVTNPTETDATAQSGLFTGEFWYIDTAYTNTHDLMTLNNIQGLKNLFKDDTLWLEITHNGSNTDRNYLYRQSGDTLWFEPQLQADSYRIMIIDSLTDTRLHYRVVNSSAPPNDVYNGSHGSLMYYEFYK